MMRLPFGLVKAEAMAFRVFSARALSTTGTQAPKQKHKIPQKRASSLLNILRNEEFEKLKNGREWPRIQAGDSIEIHKLPYMTASQPDIIKGVVIAKVNRASDTSVLMINNEFGTPVVRRILLYSPVIQDVRILQKAFIHDGKKRVRRSKIYYFMNKDPKMYTIT